MRKTITEAILMGCLMGLSTVAMASSVGNSNYQNCFSQKKTVAQAYCDTARVDCKAELSAAHRECKIEVGKGLRFDRESSSKESSASMSKPESN